MLLLADRVSENQDDCRKVQRVAPSFFYVALISFLFVVFLWIFVILFSDISVPELYKFRLKIGISDFASDAMSLIFMFVSFSLSFMFSYIITRNINLFFYIVLPSFVMSEVGIVSINMLSLCVRIFGIISLISFGLSTMAFQKRNKLDVFQFFAVIYLSWCLINTLINGSSTHMLMSLPIQAALVLGLLVGFRSHYNLRSDLMHLCKILAWIGVVFTLVHIYALIFTQEAFLVGRFRSFYPLPTNFANSYLLLFISMLWLRFTSEKIFINFALSLALIFGFVLLILSGTRNAAFSLILVFGLFLSVWKVKLPLYTSVALLLLVFSSVIFLQDSAQFEYLSKRLSKVETKSTTGRIDQWRRAIQYIDERPVIGYGLGTVEKTIGKGLPEWAIANTHNAYLGICIQLGLIGLTLVLIIYIISIFYGVKLLFFYKNNLEIKKILILPFTLLCVLFVAGMVEENLSSRGSLQQFVWAFSITMIANMKREIENY